MKIANGRVPLALQTVSEARTPDAPALLLLHALGGSAADWKGTTAVWPGAAHALDFSGHGESGWLAGGAYTPEGFAADADAALAALPGDVCIAGAGIGGYVAVLLAGARAKRVPAALVLPGDGGDGGGAAPDFDVARKPLPAPRVRGEVAHDPMVMLCRDDLRPEDYAREFAAAARCLVLGAREHAPPPWLAAVRETGHVLDAPADPSLAIRALHGALATPA